MTQQIYVNRSSSGKNRYLIPAILFLIVAGVCLVFWVLSRNSPQDIPQETVQQEAAGALGPERNSASQTFASIAEIQQKIESGELESAREEALNRLHSLQKPAQIMETEKLLGALHTRMVFSRAPMQEKISYEVKAGDTLGELARIYNTTKELIAEINGIENNIIRVGKSLQILTGTFSAVVDKSNNEMELRLNDRFFKRYAVGTGTHSSTPVGEYKITVRLRNPVWYRPDGQQFEYGHPENLLGTHYLKLNTPGIGLHGTWDPQSIGSQSSAGCVRFQNDLIEELYKLLPEGTSVKIVD